MIPAMLAREIGDLDESINESLGREDEDDTATELTRNEPLKRQLISFCLFPPSLILAVPMSQKKFNS